MTTIAATFTHMAADSLVVVDESSYLSPKLALFPDAIIGAAGDTEACHLFFDWWEKRDSSDLIVPKGMDMEALVLTRDGLYRYGKYVKPDKIIDGIMAIGGGAALAIAALDTMIKLGLQPDPVIAVEMACKRNPNTGLPVDVMDVSMLKKDAGIKTLSRHVPKVKRKLKRG